MRCCFTDAPQLLGGQDARTVEGGPVLYARPQRLEDDVCIGRKVVDDARAAPAAVGVLQRLRQVPMVPACPMYIWSQGCNRTVSTVQA